MIQKLCQQSKKAGEPGRPHLPDPTDKVTKPLLSQLKLFLRWLETSVEITPVLKTRAKIDQGLQLMYARPEFLFDEPTRERARQLYNRWEGQNWGKGEVLDDSTDDDDDDNNEATGEDAPTDAKRRKSSVSSVSARRDSKQDIVSANVKLPSASHPIFGENGIMHGLVLSITPRRRSYIICPLYTQRDAKVFGHNGIEVGSWWPMQLAALFNGAHGMKIAGISGNSELGAYSVVTSGGQYEELDQDKGDVLYYSGSQSHDNDSPREPFPSSVGTLALKASQRNRKPVRVLRAAGVGGSRTGKNIRPTVGIRYDGLYQVIAMQLKTNMKGGRYEQFKLVRLEDQPPLSGIARPTASEVRDYYKRDQGY